MPSNTQSERSDAAGGSSSKTSLLWAYQLRREHVHLVERIDGMDIQLVSCLNKNETHQETLSNLDSLIRSLQAENHSLKNEVTLVRTKLASKIEEITQQITAVVNDDEAAKDATKKLEVKFRGMGLQVSELSDRMSEFRAEIARVVDCQNEIQETTQRDVAESRQVNGDLEEKIEPVLQRPVQTETQPKLVIMLKYKKKAFARPSPEPLAKAIDDAPDSLIDQAALSTLSDSYIPDSMPPPSQDATSEIEAIFQEIRQDDRTPIDYFAFTSQLRCQLPRRKQEGHIVEAFFDGISKDDDAFKASLEAYLDEFGWVWDNLEIYCKPRAPRKKKSRVVHSTNARSGTRGNAAESQ